MRIVLQLLMVMLLTFSFMLLVSGLLDIEWIASEWARELVVYIIMILVLIIGGLIFIEIIKQDV